jgi:hypothetical protein
MQHSSNFFPDRHNERVDVDTRHLLFNELMIQNTSVMMRTESVAH